MSKTLPQTNTFQIQFQTIGSYIKTVQVTLEEGVMDVMDRARIDLAEHPLYPALQKYVKNNPR